MVTVLLVPTTVYIMLSTDWAQERLRTAGEEALQKALGVEAEIGEVEFVPFNRLAVHDVSIADDYGEKSFAISSIEARYELFDFLFRGEMVVDYAVIDTLVGHVYRATPDAPLNVSGILDRLRKEDNDGSVKIFNFRFNDIEVLNSRLSYDVLSVPETPGRFCVSHTQLEDFNVLLLAPMVSNSGYKLRLRGLSFKEASGFEAVNISGSMLLTDSIFLLEDLTMELPHSRLAFGKVEAQMDGLNSIGKIGTEYPIEIMVTDGSRLSLVDFAAFCPDLTDFDYELDIEMQASGRLDSLHLHNLDVRENGGCLRASASGFVGGLPSIDSATLNDVRLDVLLCPEPIRIAATRYRQLLPAGVRRLLQNTGSVMAHAAINGRISGADVDAIVDVGDLGYVDVKGYAGYSKGSTRLAGNVNVHDLDLGAVTGNDQFGLLTASAKADGAIRYGRPEGHVDAKVSQFGFKGYDYENIAINGYVKGKEKSVRLIAKDPNLRLDISAGMGALADKDDPGQFATLHAEVYSLRGDSTGLLPGVCSLSGFVDVDAEYESLSSIEGTLEASDITLVNSAGEKASLSSLKVQANNRTSPVGFVNVESDVLNGGLNGDFDLSTLWSDLQAMMQCVYAMPGLEQNDVATESDNDFEYRFVVENALDLSRFLKLPVLLTDPVTISGSVNGPGLQAEALLDAPYLLKGNGVIYNTLLSARLDQTNGALVNFATLMPTPKGQMDLKAKITGWANAFDANVDWEIQRDNPINGKFEILASIFSGTDHKPNVVVDFMPGTINFGKDAWQIDRSRFMWQDRRLTVDNFAMQCGSQGLSVSGTASEDPEDVLLVSLREVQLVDIFETLDIQKALVCGVATADLHVSNLFSSAPDIYSTKFFVKDMGYNYCVIGDGMIDAWYDVEKQSFVLDADLVNNLGRESHIVCSINPARSYLDLKIDADYAPVGFMQPFMEAFCSGIQGRVSGNAHLFGTFECIDLYGDIFVDDLRLKIDFTDVWYNATDSIHLTPGVIDLTDVTIRDDEGHEAKLNGKVWHKYFKEPTFDFAVTGADGLLCYDIKRRDNPRWFGQIWGRGGAKITGYPGVVNIDASMATVGKSNFSFVITDDKEALDYSFITFRDVTPKDSATIAAERMMYVPKAEIIAQEMANQAEDETKTDYNINITADIRPETEVVVITDPIYDDKISCHGVGTLTIAYSSLDEDLRMTGEYELESGSYSY
ncbi:MAG: translocation/assembly module TamB, partial [Muribaculaceae bacterium]|nr:translocation/assembly module TamB [Muribaculaceae bacterium]